MQLLSLNSHMFIRCIIVAFLICFLLWLEDTASPYIARKTTDTSHCAIIVTPLIALVTVTFHTCSSYASVMEFWTC